MMSLQQATWNGFTGHVDTARKVIERNARYDDKAGPLVLCINNMINYILHNAFRLLQGEKSMDILQNAASFKQYTAARSKKFRFEDFLVELAVEMSSEEVAAVKPALQYIISDTVEEATGSPAFTFKPDALQRVQGRGSITPLRLRMRTEIVSKVAWKSMKVIASCHTEAEKERDALYVVHYTVRIQAKNTKAYGMGGIHNIGVRDAGWYFAASPVPSIAKLATDSIPAVDASQ